MKNDKARNFGKKLLWWCIMIIIGTMIYQCGKKRIMNISKPAPPQTQAFVEDGIVIGPQSLVIKEQKETKTSITTLSDESVRITTNCREMYEEITTLLPGESIQINHKDYGPAFDEYGRPIDNIKNRCSYAANGASYPIYGGEGNGNRTRPRFIHSLPFPDMPGGAVIFFLKNKEGKIIAHDYIKEIGGVVDLINFLNEEVVVGLQYNYMKTFLTGPERFQVGWDGSTATFQTTRFK